jgi:hypothetical protein
MLAVLNKCVHTGYIYPILTLVRYGSPYQSHQYNLHNTHDTCQYNLHNSTAIPEEEEEEEGEEIYLAC